MYIIREEPETQYDVLSLELINYCDENRFTLCKLDRYPNYTLVEEESIFIDNITEDEILAGNKEVVAFMLTKEADQLFFKYQAGEITEKEWLDKRQEIKDRYSIKKDDKIKVPAWITPRQANQYLLSIGLFDKLNELLEQDKQALIEWQTATMIERNNSFVTSLGSILNLNDEQIDNIFLEASKI